MTPFILVSFLAVQSICGSRDASSFLIPVAGNVRGAHGEHFRTDLTLVNFRSIPQRVMFEFLPQGRTASGNPLTLVIAHLSNSTFPDFVGLYLRQEGIGAILVTPIREDGTPDPEGRLDSFVRIWNDLLGSEGTTSQTVLPIEVEQLLQPLAEGGWRSGSPAYVHGARHTDRYRTNIGIINLDRLLVQRWEITVRSSTGILRIPVELPAFSMTQLPVPNTPFGELSIFIEPIGATGQWRAYASSVDNASGSGWTVPATQPRTDVVFPIPSPE